MSKPGSAFQGWRALNQLRAAPISRPMLLLRPSGFIKPYLPSPSSDRRPGRTRFTKSSNDGFRLMARRDPVASACSPQRPTCTICPRTARSAGRCEAIRVRKFTAGPSLI